MEPVDPWAMIRGLPENVQATVVAQLVKDLAKRDFDGKVVLFVKRMNAFTVNLFSFFIMGAGIVGLTWCITALLISIKGMF